MAAFVWYAEGDDWRHLRLEAANKAAREVAGVTDRDVGKNWLDVGLAESLGETIFLSAVNGVPYAIEQTNEPPFSSSRMKRYCVRITPIGGRQSLATFEDITSLVRGRVELERISTDLDEAMYAISHDLQEPLRAIQGMAGLLRKRAWERLDEKAQHYVDEIVEGTDRLRRRLEGLRQFSRAGRFEMTGEVDLSEVVNDALVDLRHALEESDPIVRLPSNYPVVFGAKGPLISVFLNLLSNAIKYRSEKRRLEVCIEIVENSDGYLFEVTDNGKGFSPQFSDRIFKFGARLDVESSGDGMGLAIVKRVVERHGGRIWAKGEEDKGSRFFFTLPKVEPRKSDAVG